MEYLMELEALSADLHSQLLKGLAGNVENIKELAQAFEIINDLITIAHRNKTLEELQ